MFHLLFREETTQWYYTKSRDGAVSRQWAAQGASLAGQQTAGGGHRADGCDALQRQ